MNREVLIALLKSGMRCRRGKRQFWVCQCFEIIVHRNGIVELDEYESVHSTKAKVPEDMFHIGRSILHLKSGHLVEEAGSGWPSSSLKVNDGGKK